MHRSKLARYLIGRADYEYEFGRKHKCNHARR